VVKSPARANAAEGDASRTARARQPKRHPGKHPIESALHWMQSNLHSRIFPEQNVMLEINAGVAQSDVQHWQQFTFDVVSDTAESFVLDVCGELDGDSHNIIRNCVFNANG